VPPISASIVILIAAAAQEKADNGWFGITEAIISAAGVIIAAVLTYLGVRYAHDRRGADGTNGRKRPKDPKQTLLVSAALARVDALKDTTSPDRRLRNEKSRDALEAAADSLDQSKDSDLYKLAKRLVACTNVDAAATLADQIIEQMTDHPDPRPKGRRWLRLRLPYRKRNIR
jgi:hypothetical protein